MERSFHLEGKAAGCARQNAHMDQDPPPPITDVELLELLVRAPRSALDNAPSLTEVFTRLVDLQPEEIRVRLLAETPPAAKSARGAGADRRVPPFVQRSRRPPLPPAELLDRAQLHGRGLRPRTILLANLAGRLNASPDGVAQGLNDALLMVSLRVEGPPAVLEGWTPIFQLAAALGTESNEIRTRALAFYADHHMWEQAHLPLEEAADGLLRWFACEFAPRAPTLAAHVFASLVFSPEAFNAAASYMSRELSRIDLSVFRPLLGTLAQVGRAGTLTRENPARRLLQELVRHAVEVSGDSTDAATGLDVLFASSFGNSALPSSTDLALASAVATCVAAGRPGWRNPKLRPAMLEAALRGAPGCRRAALMLEAPR